jgi:hypothetical protein
MIEIRPNIGRRWLVNKPWYCEGAVWKPAFEYFYIESGTQFEFDFGVEK